METTQFQRKPFLVDAVRITAENLEDVAEWCKGEIREKTGRFGKVRYVKVFVNRPLGENQTEGHFGDWMLYTVSGFKIYKDHAFKKCFDPMPRQTMSSGEIQELLDGAVDEMRHFKGSPAISEDSIGDYAAKQLLLQSKLDEIRKQVLNEVGMAMTAQDAATARGGKIDSASERWRQLAALHIMDVVCNAFDIDYRGATTKSLPIPDFKPLAFQQVEAEEMIIKGAKAALTGHEDLTPDQLRKVADGLKRLDDAGREKFQHYPMLEMGEVPPNGLKTEFSNADLRGFLRAEYDDGTEILPVVMDEEIPALTDEQREKLLADSKSVAHWMLSTEQKQPGTFTLNQIREEFKSEGLWYKGGTRVLPIVEDQDTTKEDLGEAVQEEAGLRPFQKNFVNHAPFSNPHPDQGDWGPVATPEQRETYSMREPEVIEPSYKPYYGTVADHLLEDTSDDTHKNH